MKKQMKHSTLKASLLLFIISFGFLQQIFSQAAPANYEGVMLQGFYWDSYKSYSATLGDTKWNTLTSNACIGGSEIILC